MGRFDLIEVTTWAGLTVYIYYIECLFENLYTIYKFKFKFFYWHKLINMIWL